MPDLFQLQAISESRKAAYSNPRLEKQWIWLKSTHRDANGMLYGWSHNKVPRL